MCVSFIHRMSKKKKMSEEKKKMLYRRFLCVVSSLCSLSLSLVACRERHRKRGITCTCVNKKGANS